MKKYIKKIISRLKKIVTIIICFIFFYKKEIKHENALEYSFITLDCYKDYFDSLNMNNRLDLFTNLTYIENIFILIIIVPFIKKEIIITRKSKIYKISKNVFNIKTNDNIRINKTFLNTINENFFDLIYYEWESFPNSKKINYLKFILRYYYNQECLRIFLKALNMNIITFSFNKKEKSTDIIYDLMSKFYIFLLLFRNHRFL